MEGPSFVLREKHAEYVVVQFGGPRSWDLTEVREHFWGGSKDNLIRGLKLM